jgi:phospholipase C
VDQAVPHQEPGLRHARALPYELDVSGTVDHGELKLVFENTGKAGACFQVRSGNTALGPWTYTVESEKSLSDTWNTARTNQGNYDLSAFGPNGFLRGFRGSLSAQARNLDVDVRYDPDHLEIELCVTNRGPANVQVNLDNAYEGKRGHDDDGGRLRPGQSLDARFSLRDSFGWYDIAVTVDGDAGFLRRLAGHVENGEDSASDPAFGAVQTHAGKGEWVES